jgi:hypothetical protein
MNALVFLVATAAVGVDFGWQPLSDGGVEYIIQIEPQSIDLLAKDHDLSSDVPAGLDVRRFRVTVGTGKLPRLMSTAPAPIPAANPAGGAQRMFPADPRQNAAMGVPGTVAGPMGPGGAAIGQPQPITQPQAIALQAPPANVAAIPPAGVPLVAAPPNVPPLAAAPGVAATQPDSSAFAPVGSPAGPDLGPPVETPLESPSQIAARQRAAVSRALDDPHAPGRDVAADPSAETMQPKLPADDVVAANGTPRTLVPDPTSEQLAQYKATPHEAQRQNERGVGSEQGAVVPGENDRPAGEHPDHRRSGSELMASRAGHAHESASQEAALATAAPVEKNWPALTAAIAALLVSISANVYLAWVAWESRLRYRELLAEHDGSPLAV